MNIKPKILLFLTTYLTFLVLTTVYAEGNLSYVSNARVNLRAGASLSSEIYETLPVGLKLEVIEYIEDGWSVVNVKGRIGYVNSLYISTKEDLKHDENLSENPQIELIEWNEAKKIFPLYTAIKVYDIKSGLTYYIQSFSNGNHADVETLTKEDTDTMLKTYGGKWKWDPRPVWVTVNGRTFAASINGMPHGGGTISNNGMNGQVCLHFKGSSTHNGNKAFTRDHQAAVDEAWSLR